MASRVRDLKPQHNYTRKSNAEAWIKKFTKNKAQCQQANDQKGVLKYTKKLQRLKDGIQ